MLVVAVVPIPRRTTAGGGWCDAPRHGWPQTAPADHIITVRGDGGDATSSAVCNDCMALAVQWFTDAGIMVQGHA